MNSIKSKELSKFSKVISEAEEAWRTANKATYDKEGDFGSCIIGDGVEVYVVPPRCRLPRWETLISSSSVAFCQGSCHYEMNKQIAVDMLTAAGLPVRYNYGRMD